jgi:hypothetical protein
MPSPIYIFSFPINTLGEVGGYMFHSIISYCCWIVVDVIITFALTWLLLLVENL